MDIVILLYCNIVTIRLQYTTIPTFFIVTIVQYDTLLSCLGYNTGFSIVVSFPCIVTSLAVLSLILLLYLRPVLLNPLQALLLLIIADTSVSMH
jgi:glucan phosphoethanolaminetransferase (alkaline phosphatase superfamily)